MFQLCTLWRQSHRPLSKLQAGLEIPILLAQLPGVELCRRGPPCLVSSQFLFLASEFPRRLSILNHLSFHALPGQPHGFPYTRSCLANTHPCYSHHLSHLSCHCSMSTLPTLGCALWILWPSLTEPCLRVSIIFSHGLWLHCAIIESFLDVGVPPVSCDYH